MINPVSFKDPLKLPCGSVIKNRLVKSAMSDSLADGEGNATEPQTRLYERWAQSGLGLSIIGEVQVDPRFPEKPGNLVLSDGMDLVALRELTSRASINGAHIWPQLSHAGGLSHLPISKPKGPSALNIGLFQCAGMSIDEVYQLPDIYAKSAILAKKVGFTGVQIHASHGFLLSQFLSPLFNHRQDQYGGSIEARCRIIVEIIAKVRTAVGNSFPIGIKINATDQLEGGLTQEDALAAIRIFDQTSLDLIEISGGSYFPGAKSSSEASTKGPYFTKFAATSKRLTNVPIVVTGGFKTYEQALKVIECGDVDFVGLARALIIAPELAKDWLIGAAIDPIFPRFKAPPLGGITAWFTMFLTAMANYSEESFELELLSALHLYEELDDTRCDKWLQRFKIND
ncbi:MAG: 2,4-dienoyl-CoA reductase-like NADH-dependent reductase (Old Yellow Enzyme family) [Shewanella sp.]|jgi:2,4-dienoyl-CoA reductase-like NADH-dependent reductase (Old Yellow Enzyme family)